MVALGVMKKKYTDLFICYSNWQQGHEWNLDAIHSFGYQYDSVIPAICFFLPCEKCTVLWYFIFVRKKWPFVEYNQTFEFVLLAMYMWTQNTAEFDVKVERWNINNGGVDKVQWNPSDYHKVISKYGLARLIVNLLLDAKLILSWVTFLLCIHRDPY